MKIFQYRAMTAGGALVTGSYQAASAEGVVQHLRAEGQYPIAVEDGVKRGWRHLLDLRLARRRRFSGRELAVATQELSTLLRAGLDLDRALTLLSGLAETKSMHAPLTGIRARVRDGASFAEALSEETGFPKLYVSMVRAGELGGSLEATLTRLAEYLMRAQTVRDEVASALIYPAVLLATAGLSIAVILVFVLPQFEPLFAEAGKSIPLPTRIVMAIGHILTGYWWLIALVVGGAVFWFRRALRNKRFKARWDRFLLKLPLLGDLLQKMDVERFGRTLGTLLANGVALPNAMAITSDTLSNSVMASAVGEAGVSLREGETLASRLARSRLFPPMTLDLIRVGEESGKLDEMLLRQADLYERSVKQTVTRMLALLVPALTIVLGMIVAALIGSILIAILSVNELAL